MVVVYDDGVFRIGQLRRQSTRKANRPISSGHIRDGVAASIDGDQMLSAGREPAVEDVLLRLTRYGSFPIRPEQDEALAIDGGVARTAEGALAAPLS